MTVSALLESVAQLPDSPPYLTSLRSDSDAFNLIEQCLVHENVTLTSMGFPADSLALSRPIS